MEKEEKEIEMPSKGGKGGAKKRTSATPGTPSSAASAPPGAGAGAGPRAPVKTMAAPPHTALFGNTTTTAPTVPAPAATPPATHTGLPQQVNNVPIDSLVNLYILKYLKPYALMRWFYLLLDTLFLTRASVLE